MTDKKTIIFFVLLGVLGLLVSRSAASLFKAAPRGPVIEQHDVLPLVEELEKFQPRERPARSDFAWWGRTPFQKEEPLVLTGIAWDDQNPKAVIQDRIVGVGEEVRGHKIVEIQPTRVKLSNGFYEFELELPVEAQPA